MKKAFGVIILVLSLISCEKSGSKLAPDTNFNTKILDGYFVTSIAFDSKGNAWIGTFKQGLIKYNSAETVVYNSSNSIIPSSSVIWDIAVDSKDNVWIGSDGLIKYDGTRFTLYNSSNSLIPEDFVYSIDIDSKDNIWFTSCRFRQGGLVKYDGNAFQVFTPDNSDLPVNSIRSIAVDNDDNVWLALSEIVNDSYLVKISGTGWKTFKSADLGFSPYYFADIDINSQNQVCGAIDYTLSSTWPNSGPQVFVFDGHNSEQMRINDNSMLKSLIVDTDDNLWCSIIGGYAVYTGDSWIIDDSTYKEHGVFTISQSNDKRIWLGTGDGIYINN